MILSLLLLLISSHESCDTVVSRIRQARNLAEAVLALQTHENLNDSELDYATSVLLRRLFGTQKDLEAPQNALEFTEVLRKIGEKK